jgi:hypothetical protein
MFIYASRTPQNHAVVLAEYLVAATLPCSAASHGRAAST